MTDVRDDDHVRGEGPLVVMYGDLACPRCALAWERLAGAPLTVVFRHFALKAKGPRTLALAHASEAFAAQGAFFAFADAVYADQGHVDDPHLWALAEQNGLDLTRFEADRRADATLARVQAAVRGAVRAGVSASPTFLVARQSGWDVHPGPPDRTLVREWWESDLREKKEER